MLYMIFQYSWELVLMQWILISFKAILEKVFLTTYNILSKKHKSKKTRWYLETIWSQSNRQSLAAWEKNYRKEHCARKFLVISLLFVANFACKLSFIFAIVLCRDWYSLKSSLIARILPTSLLMNCVNW